MLSGASLANVGDIVSHVHQNWFETVTSECTT